MNGSELIEILLVDDSKDQFMMVSDFLEASQTDFRVDWAQSLDHAQKKITTHSYYVCLIDHDLGESRTGLDFIQELVSAGCETPLILLTGHNDRKIAMQALQVGAVDYIDKLEIRPGTLERIIRYAIERSRNLRQLQNTLEAEQHQRALAEALLDSAAALNSTLKFDEILKRILTNIGNVIPHDFANIMLIKNGFAQIVGCQGYAPEIEAQLFKTGFQVRSTISFNQIVTTQQPIVISDTREFPGWVSHPHSYVTVSYIGAPIISENEVIGFINVDCAKPGFFTIEHSNRLKAFADQAAIAIKNAQVFEQAQALAAAEERQRLARDLHDAVSQTLFSANVIAETLPLFFARKPEEVQDGLAQLAKLTKGALAEMRTLLVELRPNALLETDLSVLLTHLVNGFRTRTDAEITLNINGADCALKPNVKINFYRIAQEALNNVIKHAHASQIEVTLNWWSGGVLLSIQDNGRGFNPEHIPAGHMGIHIMRERAVNANIALEITSELNEGTMIVTSWNEGENDE
jgi:signal transduction histidine kinase